MLEGSHGQGRAISAATTHVDLPAFDLSSGNSRRTCSNICSRPLESPDSLDCTLPVTSFPVALFHDSVRTPTSGRSYPTVSPSLITLCYQQTINHHRTTAIITPSSLHCITHLLTVCQAALHTSQFDCHVQGCSPEPLPLCSCLLLAPLLRTSNRPGRPHICTACTVGFQVTSHASQPHMAHHHSQKNSITDAQFSHPSLIA